MKILYVEDYAPSVALLRASLPRSIPESRIDVVATVARAIERLQQGQPTGAGGPADYDAILTDLHLDDGTGLEVLSFVRERQMAVPVVVLSGSTDENHMARALQAGADAFVVKWGDYLATLPDTLRAAVSRRGKQPRTGATST